MRGERIKLLTMVAVKGVDANKLPIQFAHVCSFRANLHLNMDREILFGDVFEGKKHRTLVLALRSHCRYCEAALPAASITESALLWLSEQQLSVSMCSFLPAPHNWLRFLAKHAILQPGTLRLAPYLHVFRMRNPYLTSQLPAGYWPGWRLSQWKCTSCHLGLC